MSRTYVVVDVETTGLDPERDAIIEVAAVSLQNGTVSDEFSSLVQPHREIPAFISQITGITDEMVADAPSMYTLRSRLKQIMADHVLIGHNVGFDLGFLRAERLGIGQHRLDTVTLASILLPAAGRYNLEALVYQLQLPGTESGQAHRALADARQTAALFQTLQERALQLEVAQLEEIVAAGRTISWPETLFFEDVLAAKIQAGAGRKPGTRLARLFNPPRLAGRPLSPKEKTEPLDITAVAGMIKPGGNLSRSFPGFEYRPQQVEMLRAVAQALNQSQHLLVEAGTGTGKSIGYLLPAAFWASQNDRCVVVSTNTINLQDQLLNKDLPDLQAILPFELQAAVRKGRSNYLCTRLFQQMRHSGPSSADEMVLYARILNWLPHSQSGDVNELSLRTTGEQMAWSRLSGDNGCTAEHCATENCPLHMARQRAERAHILIVNHALLLSDVANENHILPPFRDLIIDEAHHLEAAVTDGLSFRADRRYFEAVLEEVTRPRAGLLGDMQNRVVASVPQAESVIAPLIDEMRREAQAADMRLDDFFATLGYFVQGQVRSRSQFAQQIRLIEKLRQDPDFDQVQDAWRNLNPHLKVVVKGFEKLANAVADIMATADIENGEDLRLALASNGRSLRDLCVQMDELLLTPQEGMIYWIESFKDRLSLHAAPLHVGPLVDTHIFKEKESAVLTSATLRTAGSGSDQPSFDYVRSRLHAHEVHELAVGSPFDYKNATLLYLPTDMPEPNQPGYQRYLEEAIVDVATALGGRTLVLFTAYGQLTQTARAVESQLAAADIVTLAQGGGASRQQLLAQFRRPDSRAVLLGTRSFWEGVDVPGPALQAVLIAKLPFDVPSDPIFAARSETFDNSFYEYSIPEAILRFRQGFGRLIRRKDDEGVVAILDKRVISKRYGHAFVQALPECMVLRQRIGRLGELTVRWLNRER
ncbi:MAG: exonuclease domain-containing protein [Chloroflexota bacterium]